MKIEKRLLKDLKPAEYNPRQATRVRELIKLGYKEVDCVILDLPLEDEKELNVRLNANTGGWDFDMLANQFDELELNDWGLEVPSAEIEEEEK